MRCRSLIPSVLLLVPILVACGSGGGGGSGGGADGEAALAAIGFTPGDLADLAAGTMAVSLDWLTNDGVVPTARFGSCPTFVPGSDDNLNGHPDTLEVIFDCTTLEGLVIAGSLFLNEYDDPQEFVDQTLSCSELLTGAGTPTWGMQGTMFLTVQEPGGVAFDLLGGVDFAEFPDIGQLQMEIHTSILDYPVDGGATYDINTNVCASLPTDDSTDAPSGFVDTFVFDGPPPALLALECQLLPNGTVAFDAFNGPDLLASGTINLAAGDGDEVTFD